MSDKEEKEVKDTAMENAVTRSLTRKEKRKKIVVLECYRDFWRRSQRPVCSLSEADPYLMRAADMVIRIRTLLTPEGDTGSPDGGKLLRAESEDDIEKAVLECVNHVACGGNSAEMLWDLEQCPSADPEKFVRELVHSTLRDADKYVFPTCDESFVDRFISIYDRIRPLGTAIEDDDMGAELEAVLEGMQKTVRALADVEVPKETLKEITQTLRSIDERLASYLPPPKKSEPDSDSEAEKKQDQPAMESDSTPTIPGVVAAKLEKSTDDDEMESDEEKKPETPADTKQQASGLKEQKTTDATAMVDDSQTTTTPITRQDSCLLKINTISTEIEAAKPKVEEAKKLVDDLNLESLMKDPLAGLEKVENVQKQVRCLSEQFMRALLALDALNTNEATRPLRRNQVIEVQQLMDQMDQINSKINSYAAELQKDPAVIEKKKRESEASLAAHKDPAVLQQTKKEQKPKTPEPEKKESAMEETEKNEEEEGGNNEDEEEEEQEEEAEEEVLLREMTPLWKSLKLRPRFDQQQQRGAYILTAMIPGLKREEIVVKQDQDPNDGTDELVVSGSRIPSVMK